MEGERKRERERERECMGVFKGVIELVSSLIGVTSNDPPCSQEWVAWVAAEGTISNGELSVASPTGYGLTREDPLWGDLSEEACCILFFPAGR